jgi:Ulp1 family protease
MFPCAVIRKHRGPIYMPQHVSGNHWVLLRIMCGESAPVWRVECLDSLGKCRLELMQQVRSFLTIVIKKFDPERTSSHRTHFAWQLLQYIAHVPQQKDASSCGVCVCVNAWHLVSGRYPSYTCIKGMQRWRLWVFSVIMAECAECVIEVLD